CLNRCIPDRQTLEAEIMARRKQRNGDNKQTSWMFTVDKAKDKIGKACPKPGLPKAQSKETKSPRQGTGGAVTASRPQDNGQSRVVGKGCAPT
ncbi:MAG: hypothetical protein OXB95_00635, partial [Rhodobacteraceae bacterium]|nr:hypothetical protein [Paracoccaceae bacterium]